MAITGLYDGSDATSALQPWTNTLGSPASSTTQAHTGPRSLHLPPGSGVFTTTPLIGVNSRISTWAYIAALPGATADLIRITTNSGYDSFNVCLTSAGALQLWINRSSGWGATTSGGTQIGATGSSTLSTGTWYQVTLAYTITSATVYEVRVFLSASLEVTVSNSTTLNRTTPEYLQLVTGDASFDVYIDDVYVDDSSALTYPGDIRVTAKLPTTVNANTFDTTNGTGAVNERPLSETNYKVHAAISTVNQNYAIEAAAAGDVDVAAATLVGYGGWIWAKGTTGGAGTPKITVNGADTAIVLTASPAYYAAYVTSGTYPSNAATIGMVSTNNADDTFLYECGMLLAYTPAAGGAAGVPYTPLRQLAPVFAQ